MPRRLRSPLSHRRDGCVNLETRKNMIVQQVCRPVTEALLAVAHSQHLGHLHYPDRPCRVPRTADGSLRVRRRQPILVGGPTAMLLCVMRAPWDLCSPWTDAKTQQSPSLTGWQPRNPVRPRQRPRTPRPLYVAVTDIQAIHIWIRLARRRLIAKKVRLPGARTIRCRARVVDRDGRGQLCTSTPTGRGPVGSPTTMTPWFFWLALSAPGMRERPWGNRER
jgi:hypothetical protein